MFYVCVCVLGHSKDKKIGSVVALYAQCHVDLGTIVWGILRVGCFDVSICLIWELRCCYKKGGGDRRLLEILVLAWCGRYPSLRGPASVPQQPSYNLDLGLR